jgi:hypothetical protein
VATTESVRKLIREALANKTSWPAKRYTLMAELIILFGHVAGMQYLQGTPASAAYDTGEKEIGMVLINAISTVGELSAQCAEAMRAAGKGEVAANVIRAIDNVCSPDSPFIEDEWATLAPQPGESTAKLFSRIRTLAARFNYTWPAAATRLRGVVHRIGDDSRPGVAAQAGNILAHLAIVVTTSTGADQMELALKQNALFKQPLLPPPRAKSDTPPGAGGGGPTSLATQRPRSFFDISLGYDAYAKVKGESLGPLPASRAQDDCVFCVAAGFSEFVDYDEKLKEEVRASKTKRFKHNPWGCPFYEPWCKSLCASCGGEVKLDELIRRIDNPGEVSRAKGAQ